MNYGYLCCEMKVFFLTFASLFSPSNALHHLFDNFPCIVLLFGYADSNGRSSVAKNTTSRYEAGAGEQVIETRNLALRTNASRRTKAKTKFFIMNENGLQAASLFTLFNPLCWEKKKKPKLLQPKGFRFALSKVLITCKTLLVCV